MMNEETKMPAGLKRVIDIACKLSAGFAAETAYTLLRDGIDFSRNTRCS